MLVSGIKYQVLGLDKGIGLILSFFCFPVLLVLLVVRIEKRNKGE